MRRRSGAYCHGAQALMRHDRLHATAAAPRDGAAPDGGDGRRRQARRRLAPDRLARHQRQRPGASGDARSACSPRCASSTTARTPRRARSSPAARGRSASSASTRRSTARPRRSSRSSRPPTPRATSSPSSASRPSTARRCSARSSACASRASTGSSSSRRRRARADALVNLPAGVPVVAVEAGPAQLGAGRRRRPVRRRGERHPAAARPRPRTVWHIAGPRDWLEAQQRVDGWRATLEAAGAEVAARARRRLEPALGLPARPAAGRGPRRDRRLRRQRPDGARPPARAARARPRDPAARSASSASTTSPRRSTSRRR